MLHQFMEKVLQRFGLGLLDPAEIIVQIFEKQSIFGPGFPHCDRYLLPFHITNMCANEMGILFGNPGDFQDWVNDNADALRDRHPYFQGHYPHQDCRREACNHYPRAIMGEYLQTKFQQAVQSAREVGLEVILHPDTEIVDLVEDGNKIRLAAKKVLSGAEFIGCADRVLLATGHWFEKDERDRFFASPWPASRLLRKIPQGAKVAVIGTSLSAVETVLTLTADGEFIRNDSAGLVFLPPKNPRRIALYSRRGLLPKVRGKMGKRGNKFLNIDNMKQIIAEAPGQLTLEAAFRLLNSELETAYGRRIEWEKIVNPTDAPADLLKQYLRDAIQGDGPDGELIWQTVLYQSFDMARDLYLNLTIKERKRFEKNYSTIFFTYAAAQPPINAEKMLALMKSGIVEVHKLGEDYRFVTDEAGKAYRFIYRDPQGKLRTDSFRYVVNARGQEKSIETNPSALAMNLLESGTVQIEEYHLEDQTSPPVRQSSVDRKNENNTYKTGSIWINPKTHRIMRIEPDGKVRASTAIYAVGAMTRGQIIDASMARGIVLSTNRIADDLVQYLTKIYPT